LAYNGFPNKILTSTWLDELPAITKCEWSGGMTPMTTAVALKVSEAKNDKLLGRGPGIQTLGASAFDDLLTSIEVIVVSARQTAECIWLVGVTLEDITLDFPGDTNPSAGRDEQSAAAVFAAQESLRGDSLMNAAGSLRP
jgi:hypothetical protein